jgi:predicted HAD superfamily Cof-like phosphohydrolase
MTTGDPTYRLRAADHLQGAAAARSIATKKKAVVATRAFKQLLADNHRNAGQPLASLMARMIADGIADLIYVAVGAALAYGIPLERVWAEVQRSNMAKFHRCSACDGAGCDACAGTGFVAVKDAGGKVQKPPGWTPPDIAGVLQKQRDDVPA